MIYRPLPATWPAASPVTPPAGDLLRNCCRRRRAQTGATPSARGDNAGRCLVRTLRKIVCVERANSIDAAQLLLMETSASDRSRTSGLM